MEAKRFVFRLHGTECVWFRKFITGQEVRQFAKAVGADGYGLLIVSYHSGSEVNTYPVEDLEAVSLSDFPVDFIFQDAGEKDEDITKKAPQPLNRG